MLMVLAIASAAAQSLAAQAPPGAPRTITLDDALKLAQANSPELAAAAAATGAAHASRLAARSVLLPSVSSLNSFIYTQPNGTDTGVYVANNGRREYFDQANLHHEIGIGQSAEYRSAAAGEDLARAQAEIVQRGLVVTVVTRYDDVVVSQRKLATAQQAQADAQRFLTISQDRERGGEAAHSDVIKAQLQAEQRGRDLQEAELALRTARNELAIVIFPTYDTSFSVVDDLETTTPLPELDTVQAQAGRNNPDIAAAQAALRQASQDVWAARGRVLPSLAMDYFYGIDATQFAASAGGVKNLGYSVMASVNVPLWNWGASQSDITAAHLRQKQANTDLSFTQRQLLADLDSDYHDAQAARAELDSLQRSGDLAAESLRLNTLRYQAGEATVLEVVDAQNTLVDSRNAYDDGWARYRLALATLQTLTGTFR
jgi:outer membrane protein